jgi:hypothetical protein
MFKQANNEERILHLVEFDCKNPLNGLPWHRRVGFYAVDAGDALGQCLAVHGALQPANITARVLTPEDLKDAGRADA